jgi:LDH2 family malate/lactate/ureidoglycolate dehydrogenase
MAVANPEDSGAAVRVAHEPLERLVAGLFAATGMSAEHAATAARVLVEADLRSVWSHGVARVPMYLERLRRGATKARPDITVERVAQAAVLVDGDNGSGLIVAPLAMTEAIELAKANGIGIAGVRRSNHFATTAFYSQMAANAGCIGLVFTNASPAMPPFGGSKPFFGTSPFGFAAPAPEGQTFTIDMAMSRIARGKLKFAAARGEAIPEGYALDAEGRPTRDGAAAFDGVMLPFGEHKGAALSWMMDVMAGVATGAAWGGTVANPFKGMERHADVGHVMIALRADLFIPMQAFMERMSELDRRVKAQPRAQGFDEILAPGEPEARKRAQNAHAGIALPPNVLADLKAEADRALLAWPFTGGETTS